MNASNRLPDDWWERAAKAGRDPQEVVFLAATYGWDVPPIQPVPVSQGQLVENVNAANTAVRVAVLSFHGAVLLSAVCILYAFTVRKRVLYPLSYNAKTSTRAGRVGALNSGN